MLSPKITKKIIMQILKSTPGVVDNFLSTDIQMEISSIIHISISIEINANLVNVLETAKNIQKQVFYELADKTDLKNFKIDIFVR